MFPGKGPGSSLIHWTSFTSIPGLTIVGRSDCLGLGHTFHFYGPEGKRVAPQRKAGKMKRKKRMEKERRKEEREEGREGESKEEEGRTKK